MRIKIIAILIPLVFVLLLFSFSLAEGKELQIFVVDKELAIIDEVQEGAEFGVYVVDLNDSSQTPLDNLTIIFNGEKYYVDANNPNTYPVCYLTAPQVSKDTDLYITARKEGYNDAYQSIRILNIKKLAIFPKTSSVKGGSLFEIIVKDDDGNLISDAKVKFNIPGIKSYTTFTDESGIAKFKTPTADKDVSLFISASKEGYASATIEVTLKGTGSAFSLPSYLIPIAAVVGIILFIFAGLVKYKEKGFEMYGEGKDTTAGGEPQPRRLSVEGIRKVRIEEIITGAPEVKIGEKVREEKLKQTRIEKIDTKPDTWVLGRDSVIARIDKKLGKSSKVDVSKWFTGKEDVIAKVDEKIRQYEKKKEHKETWKEHEET